MILRPLKIACLNSRSRSPTDLGSLTCWFARLLRRVGQPAASPVDVISARHSSRTFETCGSIAR